MAFFEDLGKKVSQTGQEAIKKTKIMAETTKINSQISAEKRVIADNISKIGERYYELFCDSPDENLAQFVAAIKEAQRKIEDCEDQINKLKGIESCPNCGTELKEGAPFCSNCGAKIEQAQPTGEWARPAGEPVEPVQRVCSSCGTPLADGVRFCGNCGSKND
jgi:hypothetical protein